MPEPARTTAPRLRLALIAGGLLFSLLLGAGVAFARMHTNSPAVARERAPVAASDAARGAEPTNPLQLHPPLVAVTPVSSSALHLPKSLPPKSAPPPQPIAVQWTPLDPDSVPGFQIARER